MSPAQVGTGSTVVDEAFAVLLCEDPEFLDSEFEAIMTANGFDAEPPEPTPPLEGTQGRRKGPRAAPRGQARRTVMPVLAAPLPGRQRSPP